MSVLNYLRLLRPVRTLLVVVLYTLIAGSVITTFLRVPLAATKFSALLLVSPVLAGSVFLGPLHEVLHRGFSFLLPDVLPALRRCHLWALGILAPVYVVLSYFILPEISPLAALGWAIAGLSLPLFNRRRYTLQGLRCWFPVLILGGIVLIAFGSEALLSMSRSQGLLIALGSLPLSVGAFWVGFGRDLHRERIQAPVYCFQTTVTMNRAIMAQARVCAAQRMKTKSDSALRDFSLERNDGSLFAWVRTLWLARFGSARVSWAGLFLGPFLSGIIFFLVMIGMGKALNEGFSIADFMDFFMNHEGFSSPRSNDAQGFMAFFIYVMLPVQLIVQGSMLAQTPARIPYPISRLQLARTQFLVYLRGLAWVTCGYLAGLLVALLAGNLFGGPIFGMGVLNRIFAIVAQSLPFIALASMSLLLKNGIWRLLAFSVCFIASMAWLLFGMLVHFQYFISPLGLFAGVMLGVLFHGFYWLFLKRSFLRRDFFPGNPVGQLLNAV